VIDVADDGTGTELTAIFGALRMRSKKMFLLSLMRLLISTLSNDHRDSLVEWLIDKDLGLMEHPWVNLVEIFIQASRATAEHILDVAVERWSSTSKSASFS
jgi:hypothetical protein